MATENRIESLRTKHKDLEDQIHEEEIRPAPDEAHLRELKQAKLRINDEIQKLEASMASA